MLTSGGAMGNFDEGTLGVAIHQQVGFRIQQHRTAHLVRPVVVMGNATQAGFDAADHDRRVGIGLAAALAVDNHRPIRALAAFVVGGVGVVMAQASVGGVAIDHRIHVAGSDSEKQIRLTQRPEGLGRGPIRLGNDADPETLRFQQPADDGHAEAGMIHVGVAGDQDNVAGIPAERVHLGARHRQEGRDAEAGSPVAATGKQVGSGKHHSPGGVSRWIAEKRGQELYGAGRRMSRPAQQAPTKPLSNTKVIETDR
jgi:hypothetical protein